MADKFSLPALLPGPPPPSNPIFQQPPASSQPDSSPIVSLLQKFLNPSSPPSPKTKPNANFNPQPKQTQQQNNTNALVLESPSRSSPIIKTPQDDKGNIISQVGTNVRLGSHKERPNVQEAALLDRGLRISKKGRLGRHHGEQNRKPWKNELSESGELIFKSIVEKDGKLGEILDMGVGTMVEGDLLGIIVFAVNVRIKMKNPASQNAM